MRKVPDNKIILLQFGSALVQSEIWHEAYVEFTCICNVTDFVRMANPNCFVMIHT